MKYKLTEAQHKNRAQIRYLGYLCAQHSDQYFMRMRNTSTYITYELWEHYKDHQGFWDSYEVSSFKIKNKPNNFKWKWLK